MFNKLVIATLAALASTVVIAGDAYSALDVDKSGAISEMEASVLPGLTDQWKTLDGDANGELSVEEFAKFETSEIKIPARVAPEMNLPKAK
jgi:hypothetical protein